MKIIFAKYCHFECLIIYIQCCRCGSIRKFPGLWYSGTSHNRPSRQRTITADRPRAPNWLTLQKNASYDGQTGNLSNLSQRNLIFDQRNSHQTQGITRFRPIDNLDAFEREAKCIRTRNRTRSLNVRNVLERNPKCFRKASETRSNEILDSFVLYMYTVYTCIVMVVLYTGIVLRPKFTLYGQKFLWLYFKLCSL